MSHHGTHPLVAGLVLGSVIAQQDAQREGTFRTVQAKYMQQGHDVWTAETRARIYMRSQPQQNYARDLANLFIIVPLLFLLLFFGGFIGLVGWMFGL